MKFKVGFKRRPGSKHWLTVQTVDASNRRQAVVLAEHGAYDEGIRKPWKIIFVKELSNG